VKDGIYYRDKNPGTWIIIGWRIKVFNRLKWNEEFTSTTWSRKLEKIYAYRDYKICDKNGDLVAIASSRWVFIEFKTNSIKVPPAGLLERYKSEDIPIFGVDEFKKLREPENQKLVYSYAIKKRDIDWNDHVNNIAYIDMIQEALAEDVEIDEIEVLYKKECKYGATVNVYCAEVGENEKVFTIKDKDTGALHVIAWVRI